MGHGVAEPPPRLLEVVSANSILLFGDSQTTPKGHGVGSATPRSVIGVARVIIFFFLIL
jgi:hypothetical protein